MIFPAPLHRRGREGEDGWKRKGRKGWEKAGDDNTQQ